MKSAQKRYYYRKERTRKKISGTTERPRLAVFRSLKQIYAQIIDDTTGNVMAADSTRSKGSEDLKKGGNIAAAERVGKRIAEKALQGGIAQVIFDRGGWPYHGRIKALAESARKAGLKF